MISDALITAAATDLVSGKLSANAQLQLLTYIRDLDRYKLTPGLFPGLADKLAAATGFTAQYLQAALNGAKAVGAGSENLGAGKSSDVNWDRRANRDEYFNDALNFLYEVPVQRPTSAVRQMESSISVCSIHRRSLSVCGCGARPVLVF